MNIWLWMTFAIAAVIVVIVVLASVPSAEALEPLPGIIAMVGGGVALGLGLRRWMDRSTARRLLSRLSRGAPGDEASAFEVSSYTRGGYTVGKVTTLSAADLKFAVSDARQSAGLRLFKRLGLSRHLDIDDRTFNDEVYVGGNAAVGSVMFASHETREAARAIFRMGFLTIEYQNGLVSAVRNGRVPGDVAITVRPYLVLLAKNASEAFHKPQWLAFAGSRASASGGGITQSQNQPLIPVHLIVSVLVGLVFLTGGLILVTSAQLRLQVYGVMFIVGGIVEMVYSIRVIMKLRKLLRAERGHKPDQPS